MFGDLLNKVSEVTSKLDDLKNLDLSNLASVEGLLDQLKNLDFETAKAKLLDLLPKLPIDTSKIQELVAQVTAALNMDTIKSIIDTVKGYLPK